MKKYLSIFLIGSVLIGTLSFALAAEDKASTDETPPALGSTPPPEVLKFLQDLKRNTGQIMSRWSVGSSTPPIIAARC
jgi:hypothetical protein